MNDRGEFVHGFCWNSIAYAGTYTFLGSDPKEGLMFKLFLFFCDDLPEGTTVYIDSRFCTSKVLAWAKEELGIRVAATFSCKLHIQIFKIF